MAAEAPVAALESGSAGLVVKAGAVDENGHHWAAGSTPPSGAALHTDERTAELAVSAGSRVEFAPKTTASSLDDAGDRFNLDGGQLSFSVEPRPVESPFVVETDEARVLVVGTEFSVVREPLPDRVRTTVRVTEGVVRVTSKLDSSAHTLRAGDQVVIERPLEAAMPEAQQIDEASKNQKASESLASPKAIRSRLKQGAVAQARQLIAEARSRGTTSEAELGVLEAEADLAEGRYSAARQRYESVFQRFPKSRQAELSLFAAAQLSRGSRAVDLTQRYLAHYPKGTFARQAQRMLDSLEKGASREP
jgi:hypothetical protein